MKKFWQFFIVLIFVFVIAGCGNEGGGNDDGNGNGNTPVSTQTCADDPNQQKCKDPATWDWQFNRSEFNGKGMQILILHGAPEEIDPFNDNFSGNRQAEKKAQIYDIQKEYNVQIKFEKYPDSAAWGPDRVAWLNNLYAQKIEDQGDIFAISSDWVPTLVGGNSIAELATWKKNVQSGGIFGELKYTQSAEKNQQYKYAGKIYGYSNGSAHADTFLYYNQDLVDQYHLEDPATLWNEGRWDWTTFYNYLVTAQNAFPSDVEAEEKIWPFGGYVNEVAQGMLSARGGKFVDPDMELVLFKQQSVKDMYNDLRTVYANIGWAPDSISHDVSSEFQSGHQLITHGSLWFLTSEMRFKNEAIKFKISLVPYPTADGDGAAREHYTIPMGTDSGYAFRKVENGANGLTTKVLVNIMDDICRGIAPEFSAEDMTDEEAYIVFLQNRIESAASIQAVMSVETKIDQYGYTDYLWVLSKAVGNGSDWIGDGFAMWGQKLVNPANSLNVLDEKYDVYQAKLKEILTY